MKKRTVGFALFGVLLLVVAPFIVCGATDIDAHIVHGGYLYSDERTTLQYNANDSFIPASTIKILTSLIGLKILGPDYRFETHFFLDGQNNLYIKGFGDPGLTSEAVLKTGQELAAKGIKRVTRILLDDSVFSIHDDAPWLEGSANPYDAPNGSLAVNFNALPLAVSGTGQISSGEEQTPLLPLMIEVGKNFEKGVYRININTLGAYDGLSAPLRYAGELFVEQLSRAGIIIDKGFHRGQAPDSLRPVHIHKSEKQLTEIIRDCLKYSNNFIANQIFLSYGAARFGLPATWEKSRETTASFLQGMPGTRGLPVKVQEGSGISRENRISPAALCTVLEHFKPYSALLQQSGPLLIKSGTLNDVFCYAGFLVNNNSLSPFVIMLNQKENRRDAILEKLLTRKSLKNSQERESLNNDQ